MALRNMMKFLKDKKEAPLPQKAQEESGVFLTGEDFPIFRADEVNLAQYQKVPLTELAVLGAAFSTLPESARTITKLVTTNAATDVPIFAGLWPHGVAGTMVDKGLGFSGNIVGNLPGGGTGITGRMRYQLLGQGLPVTNVTNTIVPFDPMNMMVAAALISMNNKLDALQAKAEEILQFLKKEKQAAQRGNLNMLAEIMEEYKQNDQNEKLCALRAVAVQNIKNKAYQDIEFYEGQILDRLKTQKGFHGMQRARELQEEVTADFYEYRLANYLYAYSSFLEILLQKQFGLAAAAAEKMKKYARKYKELYHECRTQIANYQRSAIEAKLLGGIGSVTRTVGEKIAAVPVLSKGPVDEAMISAGNTMGRYNKKIVAQKLEEFSLLEESGMEPFIGNVGRLDLLYTRADAMLTDGENLYLLTKAA